MFAKLEYLSTVLNYDKASRLCHSFIPRMDMVEYDFQEHMVFEHPYVYIAEHFWGKEEVPSYYSNGDKTAFDLSDVGLSKIQ